MSVTKPSKPARKASRRRGPRPAAQLARPDYPFTMRLPDGRVLFVEIPGRWTIEDRDGSVAFLPDAVRLIDRVQALAMSALDRAPSPGYISSLREGLGLTQQEFGERIGVDSMTVSRWERGTMRPRAEAVKAIEALRKRSIRQGVTLEA